MVLVAQAEQVDQVGAVVPVALVVRVDQMVPVERVEQVV
jgi:hypothetical protein